MKPMIRPMSLQALLATISLLAGNAAFATDPVPPRVRPPGDPKTTATQMLSMGAGVLQRASPLRQLDVYLVGFKRLKADPARQMEVHKYCNQVNEEFAQCVIFDGNTREANMMGIEYVVSERLFDTLPSEERQYWHPLNYEILSGQLVAPGIPQAAEHRYLASKMNSYAKAWVAWTTGTANGMGTGLPIATPQLAWSFSRDGELSPDLLQSRDRLLDIRTDRKREQRADLLQHAHPQQGVDALRDAIGPGTVPVPGIVERERSARPNLPSSPPGPARTGSGG